MQRKMDKKAEPEEQFFHHFFPFREAHLCFSWKQICALTRIKYVLLRRTQIFSLSELCFSRKQICASMRSKFVLVVKALFPFRGVHPCSLKQICAFTRKKIFTWKHLFFPSHNCDSRGSKYVPPREANM